MLCDVCHKNIATVHLTEIVDGKVVELHLCQACASVKAEELKHQLSLSDFLPGLVEYPEPDEKVSKCCPACGLTFEGFKKSGRLGCSRCYETFRSQLTPLFRKIHGAVEHAGKTPCPRGETCDREKKISDLKEKLQRAVKVEEYEEAARLRDSIRSLEQDDDEKE